MENNELMEVGTTNLNKGVVVVGAVVGGLAAFVLIPKAVKAIRNKFGKKEVGEQPEEKPEE